MLRTAFKCSSALNKSDEIGVFCVKNSMRSNKIPSIYDERVCVRACDDCC